MTPMWLCSGVFFSYEHFPEALHPAIRALPLTALADALRKVSSEAAPLSACWHELSVLTLWSVLSFAIALRTFRWQ
jgi:ABC-type polysaccharide/polyol phosphate export permease